MDFSLLRFFFSFFFSLSIIFGVSVIVLVNPMYSIISLILLFISVSLIFLLLGAEFIAFSYILVYVGAILILFLWIVMTMPVRHGYYFNKKFMYIFFFISIFFIFYFYLNYPVLLKIIQISPDNFLFSYFVLFFKKNFSLIISSSFLHSEFDINDKLFMKNIYTIQSLKHFFLMYPFPFEADDFIYNEIREIRKFFIHKRAFGPLFFSKLIFVHNLNIINLNSFDISYFEFFGLKKNFLLIYTTSTRFFAKIKNFPISFNLMFGIPDGPIYLLELVFGFPLNPHLEEADFLADKFGYDYSIFLDDFGLSVFTKIGFFLYSQYCIHLFIIGMILLLAMINSISLLRFNSTFLYSKASA